MRKTRTQNRHNPSRRVLKVENSKSRDNFSVLIPDGESGHAIPVLRCLSQIKGIIVYVLSNNPWISTRFSRYSNQFFSQPKGTGDEERLLAIHDIVKKTKVDVILPVDQQTIRLLSVHGRTLSHLTAIAPVPETNAFDISTNKWLFAEWLKKNDLPFPPTILYQTDKGFEQRLSAIPFPALIKPAQGHSGDGIEYFDNPLALLRFCKEHIGSEEFIIQSYIRGYDIDCSVLCQNGTILAYTIQKGFMAGGHRFAPPIGIDLLFDKNTYDVTRELVKKFNWSGIVHLDLRYDEQENQVKVIEMNPRFWASLLGSLSAGVNFPYLACLAGLKRDLPEIEFQPKRFITFITGRATISILAQRFVRSDKANLYFDSSNLEYILKDPLPDLANILKQLMNAACRH